jgi:hypothetical protein
MHFPLRIGEQTTHADVVNQSKIPDSHAIY